MTTQWKSLRHAEIERQAKKPQAWRDLNKFQRVIVWLLLYLFNMAVYAQLASYATWASFLLFWSVYAAVIVSIVAAGRIVVGGNRHEIKLRKEHAATLQALRQRRH